MRKRERAMDEVIAMDNDIRAINEEACQILESNQRVIPQAGLSLLDKSAGQSHWEFLKSWYRQHGWMKE